ncbi:MAG: hypothetical protein ABI740_10025 [Alphaproteobacteria bacterium]
MPPDEWECNKLSRPPPARRADAAPTGRATRILFRAFDRTRNSDKGGPMPIASNRPHDAQEKKLGGSKTATNETPVSSADQPDPSHATTQPARRFDPFPTPAIDGDPADGKPTGHDHPDVSEHDHSNEKLHGESERQIEKQDSKR